MESFSFGDFLSGKAFGLSSSLTTSDILLSLLITFVITLFIFYIYKKTYSGVLYSREFNVTLIVVSMVVTVIMLGISRNLALSLGMVGALSIVRFRTAIKDPRDITFIFWSISIGIINGIQLYQLSFISSIIIGILLIVLSKKVVISHPYMLILKSNTDFGLDNLGVKTILNKYCKKYKIRNTALYKDNNELILELRVKKNKENLLLKEIKALKGVEELNMFSFTGSLGD